MFAMGYCWSKIFLLFASCICPWSIVYGRPEPEDLAGVSGDDDAFELSVIHWNDFHARFEQTSWNSGVCPEGQEPSCVGGIARIHTEVGRLVAERPDSSVFLNAGDVFQGTLWYTLFRWNVTAEFMNMLPHDALVLGNHEFDNGIDGVVPFMENLKFPVVICNVDDSEEPTFQGLYNKSIVIERKGRKIGIVGVILSTTNEIANTGRLRFLDEAEAVASEIAELKAQGVDIIIGLSHCGYDVDQRLAERVPDLDVIVGAHSHTLLYTGTPPRGDTARGPYPTVVEHADGRKVLVVQASAHTKYLGHLLVNFSAAGEPVSWTGNPILMDSSIEQDAGILEAMEPYRTEVNNVGRAQVGSTKVYLGRSCSTGECNLGSMITDAMVEEYVNSAPENAWTYASIAIINSGGIRAAIVETNGGVITYNDLAIAQPFANTIDTLELQGRHLLEVLERSVSTPYSAISSSSSEYPDSDLRQFSGQGFLQYSGIRVVFNISRAIGNRVQSLRVLCDECLVPEYRDLDLDKWYRIAVVSFLVTGGDGFSVIPTNMRNHTIGRTDVDIFMEYLAKNHPITQGLDGRITVIQEGE